MKKTLLFVRERAKEDFIRNANRALKFANNVAKEAREIGFNDIEAWKIAEMAYNRPNPKQLEDYATKLYLNRPENIEQYKNFVPEKLAEIIRKPDMTAINNLIQHSIEEKHHFADIPFGKIKNGEKIELDSVWLTSKMETFYVYTENEGHARTFQLFAELVQNINKLVSTRNQKQYFEFLEAEGLVKWENDHFNIETKASSIERLFLIFGATPEKIKQRESKELKYSGNL